MTKRPSLFSLMKRYQRKKLISYLMGWPVIAGLILFIPVMGLAATLSLTGPLFQGLSLVISGGIALGIDQAILAVRALRDRRVLARHPWMADLLALSRAKGLAHVTHNINRRLPGGLMLWIFPSSLNDKNDRKSLGGITCKITDDHGRDTMMRAVIPTEGSAPIHIDYDEGRFEAGEIARFGAAMVDMAKAEAEAGAKALSEEKNRMRSAIETAAESIRPVHSAITSQRAALDRLCGRLSADIMPVHARMLANRCRSIVAENIPETQASGFAGFLDYFIPRAHALCDEIEAGAPAEATCPPLQALNASLQAHIDNLAQDTTERLSLMTGGLSAMSGIIIDETPPLVSADLAEALTIR